MSSVQDIVTSLTINSAISGVLIAAYALLKDQPINSRIYYGKLILCGKDVANRNARDTGIGRYVNLNMRAYLHVMDWLRNTLKMSEDELVKHAGLDSAIYLRILVLGMKIFIPMMIFSFVVLVPINVTDNELKHQQHDTSQYTYGSVDTITISNVRPESARLWAHLIAAYLYTIWTCYLLLNTYQGIVDLRFKFLAEQKRRPDHFTVLCRCVPKDQTMTVKAKVDKFFRKTHSDHYLLNNVVYDATNLENYVAQKEVLKNKINYWEDWLMRKGPINRPLRKNGFWGLWGKRVDRLEYYGDALDDLNEKIREEREEVLKEEEDNKKLLHAAFVSFDTRWGAAVCSQTKQSKDSALWLTDWAPEPRDVYWANLAISHLWLNSRRLITTALLILLIIFFILPVSFVQSLANLDKIERKVHFLKPLIELGSLKSILQGFLPGLVLKIFMGVLPLVLWYMSSFEGHISYSKIERRACVSYLIFMLVNTFLANVVAGTALEQLKLFIERPTEIPNILGKGIPQRSTFFITYILVDGWTHCAMDLFRVMPFLIYYIKKATVIRTERDKELATPVGWIKYVTAMPRLGFYFLLGFVYSTISPLLLPFIIVYLVAAYVVYRTQMINAYDQKYESAGRYWPVMFGYTVIGLLVMHASLIGLMALKKATQSTPFLLPLPIATICLWMYCNQRFGDAFRYYPLEEVSKQDVLDQELEPELDHREFLERAYVHPALRAPLTGDLSATDADTDLDELFHRPVFIDSSKDNDLGIRNNGSVSQRKLLESEESNSDEAEGKQRSRQNGNEKEENVPATRSERGGENELTNSEVDKHDLISASPPRSLAASSGRSVTTSQRRSTTTSPRRSVAASPRQSTTTSPRTSANPSPPPSPHRSPGPLGRDRNSIGHQGP